MSVRVCFNREHPQNSLSLSLSLSMVSEGGKMGNKYDFFHHQKVYCKATFLPMLCPRPSIKDVQLQLPNRKEAAATPSFCDDPLSPRISCVGKVKPNNRLTGFPASHSKLILPTKTTHPNITFIYSPTSRFFSAKNVAAPAAAPTGGSRRRQLYKVGGSGSNKGRGNQSCDTTSIVDLDPPLPVIKQVRECGEVDTLWKRRSHGIALQSLKLQPIQGCLQNHLQPSTF